jgi:hypothetical protein
MKVKQTHPSLQSSTPADSVIAIRQLAEKQSHL